MTVNIDFTNIMILKKLIVFHGLSSRTIKIVLKQNSLKQSFQKKMLMYKSQNKSMIKF